MHVYCFDFLCQAKHLYLNKELMANSLWHYDPKVNNSGDRLYSKMNTGDFWKLGVEYVSKQARLPTADQSLIHHFCPVILFIDSTLADQIGRLKVEPVLCSFGNICGDKRCLATSWFILGFIPPYPKSSIKVATDRSKVDSKHDQIEYYHQCLRSILQDLLRVDKNEHGHELYVSGYGMIRAHFKLSLVGDTEGQLSSGGVLSRTRLFIRSLSQCWREIYSKVVNQNGYRRLLIEQMNWGSVGLMSFVVLSSQPSDLATVT
jgi:hypothetical protein